MANDSIIDIKEILNDYSSDIQEGIVRITKEVAKEDVTKLKNTKNTYTVRSGDYNKSWTYKAETKQGTITCIVHNKDHYRLTHLLENGHKVISRDGTVKGQTRAFKHIAPVEEESNSTYQRRIEELIRNGG